MSYSFGHKMKTEDEKRILFSSDGEMCRVLDFKCDLKCGERQLLKLNK